ARRWLAQVPSGPFLAIYSRISLILSRHPVVLPARGHRLTLIDTGSGVFLDGKCNTGGGGRLWRMKGEIEAPRTMIQGNPKIQIPNPKQIPNSKYQSNRKLNFSPPRIVSAAIPCGPV